MTFYTNRTRFAAIVTIRIDSIEDAKYSLQIGHDGAYDVLSATPGYADFYVGAGEEIQLVNNTKASFISVRGVQ